MQEQDTLESIIRKYLAWLKIYRQDVEKGLKEPDERLRASGKGVDASARIIHSTFQVITKNYRKKSIKLPDYKNQLIRFKPLFDSEELLHYPTLHSREIHAAIETYLPTEDIKAPA